MAPFGYYLFDRLAVLEHRRQAQWRPNLGDLTANRVLAPLLPCRGAVTVVLKRIGSGFCLTTVPINYPMAAWIPYALFSALFAALTAIFAKIGIKGVDSDLATAIRTAVILVLAWGIALARGATAGLPALTQRTWLFLVLSGLATGASWLCYFRALKLGPVTKVAPVDKLSVALSLLLAVVFLGETISVRGALGAGLILAGTVVLVWA